MKDCKLRCIRGSMEFTKGNIYTIKNYTLVGDENELVDGATYYQDGDICDSDNEYMFTIKQNLPLGDKQYILKEEIGKYESANR